MSNDDLLRKLYRIVHLRELMRFIEENKLDRRTTVEQWNAVHYVYFASGIPTAANPPDIGFCVSLYRKWLES